MRVALFHWGRQWHVQDLLRAAQSDFQLVPVDPRRLLARISSCRELPWEVSDGTPALSHCEAGLILGVPGGGLEQVVFRMDAWAAWEQSGRILINPPKAIETCVDKFLTLFRLQQSGLPVPRTVVCQSVEQALIEFGHLGNRVVQKPIFGSQGRGLILLESVSSAREAFERQLHSEQVIYLQEYIEHSGWDLRLFVIDRDVLGMRRENPRDWRTNAALGAATQAHSPSSCEVDLARRAAESVGAVVAGVDLVYDRTGQPWIVEVNSAPGWRFLAAATGSDVARLILEELNRRVTSAKAPAPRSNPVGSAERIDLPMHLTAGIRGRADQGG